MKTKIIAVAVLLVTGAVGLQRFTSATADEQVVDAQIAADEVLPVKRLDVGKGRIELPTKTLLELPSPPPGKSQQSATSATEPSVLPRIDDPDGEKVAAGAVSWHANFPEALLASQQSGKPVLLFQLMGRLDDRFC